MIVILCFHLLPIFDPSSDKWNPAKWNHILWCPGGSTYRESTVIWRTSTLITTEPKVQCLSTWISLESLSNALFKNVVAKAMFFLTVFERYCSSKVGQYYDPQNGLTGAKKRVRFSVKTKTMLGFVGITWKVIVLQAYEVSNSF